VDQDLDRLFFLTTPICDRREVDLGLEDALKAVDEARVYLKVCTDRLEVARKKIEIRAEPEATPD